MSIVYAVGCNFRSAVLEREWNDWYNGPKTAQMLSLPLFENVQRFKACALDVEVSYLAVWLLGSADALSTPEYVSTWGFDRWADEITDWTRDLITPLHEPLPPVPTTDETPYLHVAWFDEPSDLAKAADEARGRDGSWWWGTNAGLDGSFAHIGISAVRPEFAASPERAFTGARRESVLRPISGPGRDGS
ncbi:hypothetical protein [Streptomyces naphthomycinicus]|uniref:hypothetical protein n=1 Tax=Streptomyces naphthomycinicus TaxID=2872625 RepID=UPI001CEDE562|nr:hypothetical protein [Streptomyces sp. TML10]